MRKMRIITPLDDTSKQRFKPNCKVCPLSAISRQSFSNFNTRYLISNDNFSHTECNIPFQTIIFPVLVVLAIRRLSTEQCLELNSDKSFLLKTLLYSAVMYDKYTRNTLDSNDIVYYLF